MTRCRLVGLVFVCAVVFSGLSAEAQEPRQDRRFGLTVGYPSSGGLVGVVWQTSDKMAFRPEFSVTGRWAGENVSGSNTAYGLTVTVLRYIARKESVSAYIGPRLSYSRTASGGSSSTTTNSAYSAGATVGLQYELTRRIGVFGEVGAVYTFARSTMTGAPILFSSSTHVIASRSSVGLNLYF